MRRELRPLVRQLGLRPVATRRNRSATDAHGATLRDGSGRSAFGLWTGGGAGVGGGWGELAAATVGVGPAVAGARAGDLLEELAPGRVLVVGVAGAISPALRVADVVRPDVVVEVATGHRFPAPPPMPGAAAGRAGSSGAAAGAGGAGGAPGERGTLVTVSELGQVLPAALGAEAVAVDMESAAIARACEERGVHWRVVRAVSDLPGTLDRDVASLLSADGGLTLRALVRLLGRDPARVAALVRLGSDTRRAIAAATAAAIEELDRAGPAVTA